MMNISNGLQQLPIAISTKIARLLLIGIVVFLSTVIYSKSYASSNCFSSKDILDNNVDQMLLSPCDQNAQLIHDIHLNRFPAVKLLGNLDSSFSLFFNHFKARDFLRAVSLNNFHSSALDSGLFFIEITNLQNITEVQNYQSLRPIAYWYSLLAMKIDLIEMELKNGDLQTTRSHLVRNIQSGALGKYILKNEIGHLECFTAYDVPNFNFEIVISSPIVMNCLQEK